MDLEEHLFDVGPIAMRTVRQLRRQILVGRLTEGMLLPSVRKLAHRTGIGLVTAHKALRRVETEGWAERDDEGRRLRVVKEAPRVAREFFEKEPPSVIYWVIPNERRLTFTFRLPELSEGLQAGLPFCSSRYCFMDPRQKELGLEHLLQERTRYSEVGYILVSTAASTKRMFAERELPCVLIGDREPGIDLPNVHMDYRKIGLLAGRILCRFERIAAICGEELVGGEPQLIDGVSDAARVLGRPLPKPDGFYWCVPCDGVGHPDMKALDALLARAGAPISILATRTEFAMAVLRAASLRGMRVPQDLQLIAIPHHPLLQYCTPQISSIGMPTYQEVGHRCADLLAEVFLRGPGIIETIDIEPTLIERESTLAPHI